MPLSAALLRLCGTLFCILVLVLSVTPLRRAALVARDALVDAVVVGQLVSRSHALTTSYALRFGTSYDLARTIQRAALVEGIDPELGFRLVRVESRFRERAISSAGARGLTQLMPATAAELQPGITAKEIFQPETNLRLGFRYLRWLLDRYDGDLAEALHAYNRGPGVVARIRARGGAPANGYAERVLGGDKLERYEGPGRIPTGALPMFSKTSTSAQR